MLKNKIKKVKETANSAKAWEAEIENIVRMVDNERGSVLSDGLDYIGNRNGIAASIIC